MRKTKILFIHHGSGIGGAPISLLNLIKNLDKDRFQFKVVFFLDGDICKSYKKAKIDYEVYPVSREYFCHHSKGMIPFYAFYKYLKIIFVFFKISLFDAPKYLKKNMDFDIVHLNSDVLSSWAIAAANLNFSVVCHNRDPIANGYFGYRKAILKHILTRYTHQLVSISIDNSKRLDVYDKTKVIYNHVAIPYNFRTPFSSDKIRVLYLGGSAKIKGFQTAVDCLSYLNKNIIVQFAGSLNSFRPAKTLKEKLVNLIKLTVYRSSYLSLIKLLRSKNAEVVGQLENPYPFIDGCDILITPFTVSHFSRPAMEAFAFGKPVVGSDVEGMDEIIDHGLNGLLFEKNNPKKLAEAINYLAAHPEKGRAFGENGRKKAMKVFSPEVNTAKVEEIYNSLMKNKA